VTFDLERLGPLHGCKLGCFGRNDHKPVLRGPAFGPHIGG